MLESEPEFLVTFHIASFLIILVTKIIRSIYIVQPQFLNASIQNKAGDHIFNASILKG